MHVYMLIILPHVQANHTEM